MKYDTPTELKKQESDIFTKTNNESPEIGWFFEFYKILLQILSIIPKKRDEGELPENTAIYFLVVKTSLQIIHTSNSILNLISKGYYHQGMILLRSIQEEYHHLLFFIFHPQNQIKQWCEGKIKYKNINKYVNSSKYKCIPNRWKPKYNINITMYNLLSKYVHPTIEGWSSILKIEKDQRDIKLKLLPSYEKNSFNTVFTGVITFLGNTITLLMEKYNNEIFEAGIRDDVASKLKQFDSEYFLPLMELMKSDYDTRIIG